MFVPILSPFYHTSHKPMNGTLITLILFSFKFVLHLSLQRSNALLRVSYIWSEYSVSRWCTLYMPQLSFLIVNITCRLLDIYLFVFLVHSSHMLYGLTEQLFRLHTLPLSRSYIMCPQNQQPPSSLYTKSNIIAPFHRHTQAHRLR